MAGELERSFFTVDAHGIGQFLVVDADVAGYRRQDPVARLDAKHDDLEQVLGEAGRLGEGLFDHGERRMRVQTLWDSASFEDIRDNGIYHPSAIDGPNHSIPLSATRFSP